MKQEDHFSACFQAVACDARFLAPGSLLEK